MQASTLNFSCKAPWEPALAAKTAGATDHRSSTNGQAADPPALFIHEHRERQALRAGPQDDLANVPGAAAKEAAFAAAIEREALEIAVAVEEHLADLPGILLLFGSPGNPGQHARERGGDPVRISAEALDPRRNVLDANTWSSTQMILQQEILHFRGTTRVASLVSRYRSVNNG
jgi:hypothetical protein